MADIELRYMTIEATILTAGIDFSCWMSTADFWNVERKNYPFDYQHIGDRCTWLMHSNIELTNKIVSMAAEQADRICRSTILVNQRRKLANR